MLNEYTALSTKTLTASATQTLLVVKPGASAPAKIILKQFWVSFNGSAAAAAILCELCRVSTDGTGAASPPTPKKVDPNTNDASTATILHNHTAEPTLVDILENHYISPNSGLLIIQYPLDEEYKAIAGGDRLSLRVTTPAAVTPSAAFGMKWVE
jgi:hypothetical protein